jgi:hypothetical protein
MEDYFEIADVTVALVKIHVFWGGYFADISRKQKL